MSTTRTRGTAPAGSGVAVWAYPNARIRGMRARLLDRGQIEALMDAGDLGSFAAALSQTDWGPALDEVVVAGLSLDAVDAALGDRYAATCRRVTALVPQAGREPLAVLLGRWDVHDFKTVLRGKHAGCSDDEVAAALVPAGRLSAAQLRTLVEAPDVRAVLDLLAIWGLTYVRVVADAWAEYLKTRDLTAVEDALDRRYYAWAASRLKGPGLERRRARLVLGTQADTTNVITALRSLKSQADQEAARERFVPGGTFVDHERFERLIAGSDATDLQIALKGTPYADALADALPRYADARRVSSLERAMEAHALRRVAGAGAAEPFGLGPAVAYLWGLADELADVRICARVAAGMIDARRATEEIVVV